MMSLLLVVILVFYAVIISMPHTASALDPPVLDGLIDTIFYTGSVAYYANSTYPEASGYVYIIDGTNIDPDYAWVVGVINSSYVDNTYGTGKVGTYRNPTGKPCGHNFGDLLESDGQEFKFYNCTNELVFHAFFDLIDGPGLPTNASAALINLTYDPTVVQILTVWGSDFDYFNYTLADGKVRMIRTQDGAANLQPPITFAEVTVKAIGNPGDCKPLNLEGYVVQGHGTIYPEHEFINGSVCIITGVPVTTPLA